MSMLKFRVVALALTVLSASLASAGERAYTYYDIFYPVCPTDPRTEAYDINDRGVVVGYYGVDDCLIHGFTWFNGVMTDVDHTYEDGLFRACDSISETGTLVGHGDPDKVLVLEDGVVQVMPTPLDCAEQSFPNSINDAGTMIAGQCSDGGSIFFPAVYWIADGTALALDLVDLLPGLPDDAGGEATDVNDDGVVIGIVDGEQRAFIWQDGVMAEIFNGLGGQGVVANAINNLGLIVGLAGTADDFPAMSYDMNTGVMTVLGSGAAHDVNDRGWASGDDIINLSASHAILYKDGEYIDLHELILGEYLVTTYDNAINNYGWIVGWGLEDGAGSPMHGWLLVPIYDKGDFDGDGDVDLQDSGHFQRCFAAEPYIDGTLHVGCSVFDFDDDIDLDLDDYAAFQSAFTGPTAPNNNPNGPG